jgi:RimJ/RimL family protein N-acetyltransferase
MQISVHAGGEPVRGAVLPGAHTAARGGVDAHRPRSRGPLDAAGLAAARAAGIALAYDPAQTGWVVAHGPDDLFAPPAPAASAARGAITLRPWTAADAPVFAAILGNPNLWAWLPDPYPGPLSPAMARDLIAVSNGAAHHRVLAVEAGGTVMGQVRLLFAAGGAEAEISYWLGEGYWGRGIASAAVAAMTARAWADHPALRAITARVHARNPASARVLAKAGYRRDPGADAAPWTMWQLDRV